MEVRLERINHPTDFSRDSEIAFYHALRLAIGARADLDILHVGRDAYVMQWESFPSVDRTLELWGMLPPGAEGSEAAGVHVEKVAAYGKEPVRPILDHLDEFPADLIVLAAHRRQGLDRWLHKEIGPKLTRRRSVMTLFLPEGSPGFVSPSKGTVLLRRILIPVDWIPSPQEAVDAAAEMARTLGCEELELTLLHVSDRAGDLPAVDLPEEEGWTWRQHTASGDVVEAVLGVAGEADADLIVMATQGHDGFLDALRGSTTERVLRQATCPVLAVPALASSVAPGI